MRRMRRPEVPERRIETGAHTAFWQRSEGRGIRTEGAADAVSEGTEEQLPAGILCRYMLATLGANIVCVPEATLKSLKIRR